MTNPLMYGDTITVKVNPLLEQEIAQILENWVVSMLEKGEIDILQEQFQAMREIIHKLTELGEVQSKTQPQDTIATPRPDEVVDIQSMIQDNYQRHSELDLNSHDYEQMYKSLVSFIKEEIWYRGVFEMSIDELRKSEPTILIKLLVSKAMHPMNHPTTTEETMNDITITKETMTVLGITIDVTIKNSKHYTLTYDPKKAKAINSDTLEREINKALNQKGIKPKNILWLLDIPDDHNVEGILMKGMFNLESNTIVS